MTDVSGRNRVQAGVPTGGEFATEAKGENSDLAAFDDTVLDPWDSTLEKFAPTHPQICRVEDGTALDLVLVNDLFEGSYREVDQEFRQQNFDLIDEGYENEIREWLSRAREAGLIQREYSDLSDEEIESFQDFLDERDDSCPVDQLIEEAPPTLLRAMIGMPDERTPTEKPTVEEKAAALRSMLADAGLTPDDEDDFREFAEKAPWGKDCQLDVAWYDAPKNAMPSFVQGDRTEVDLVNPYVALVNGKTGEAMELKTRGTRTIRYPEWEAKAFDDHACQDVPFVDGVSWGASMDARGDLHLGAFEQTARRRDFSDPKALQGGAHFNAYSKGFPEVADTIAKPDASEEERTAAILRVCARGRGTWADNERDTVLAGVVNALVPNAPRQVAEDIAYKASYATRPHRADSAETRRVVDEWASVTGRDANGPDASEAAWDWKVREDIRKAMETWG